MPESQLESYRSSIQTGQLAGSDRSGLKVTAIPLAWCLEAEVKLLQGLLRPGQCSESQECKRMHAHANRHSTPSSAHAHTRTQVRSISVVMAISFSAGCTLLPRRLLGHPGFAHGATALLLRRPCPAAPGQAALPPWPVCRAPRQVAPPLLPACVWGKLGHWVGVLGPRCSCSPPGWSWALPLGC